MVEGGIIKPSFMISNFLKLSDCEKDIFYTCITCISKLYIINFRPFYFTFKNSFKHVHDMLHSLIALLDSHSVNCLYLYQLEQVVANLPYSHDITAKNCQPGTSILMLLNISLTNRIDLLLCHTSSSIMC